MQCPGGLGSPLLFLFPPSTSGEEPRSPRPGLAERNSGLRGLGGQGEKEEPRHPGSWKGARLLIPERGGSRVDPGVRAPGWRLSSSSQPGGGAATDPGVREHRCSGRSCRAGGILRLAGSSRVGQVSALHPLQQGGRWGMSGGGHCFCCSASLRAASCSSCVSTSSAGSCT